MDDKDKRIAELESSLAIAENNYQVAAEHESELEADLDAYEQCVSCDVCGALTDEPIDAGGHLQCKGCTLEAKCDQLRTTMASSEALVDNMQREINQLRAALSSRPKNDRLKIRQCVRDN